MTYSKICPDCQTVFKTDKSKKIFCDNCLLKKRRERARVRSKKKYKENPKEWIKKVQERYWKNPESKKAYCKQYRIDHAEEIRAKDKIRNAKRRKPHPYIKEIVCVKCETPIVAKNWKKKYCDKCLHEVELERGRVIRQKRGYNREYHRKYYGEKNLQKNREKAQDKQKELMKFADCKPLTTCNPMEYAAVGVERLSSNLCRCLDCGKEYVVSKSKKGDTVNTLRRRLEAGMNPCPYCGTWPVGSSSRSVGEMNLAKLYPNFTKRNVRFKWLKGQELDLFDPQKKIAIEFHGIRWHSTRFHSEPNYHKEKCDLAESAGIKLVQIYESEWISNKDCVLDLIDKIVEKKVKKYKINELVVQEVKDKDLVNKFLDKNDLSGCATFDCSIGLFLEDKLVGVCCLKQNESDWNVVRYATKLHCVVDGGLADCVREFSKIHPEVTCIFAYADRRWGALLCDLYESNGFSRREVMEPDFYYTDLKSKHSLFTRDDLKEIVLKDGKCEEQNEKKLGYYRIYDAGKVKYELFLSNKRV